MTILKYFKIDYSLLLGLLLFLFSGLFIEILLIYLVVLMHELGHIFFMKLFNCKISNINFKLVGCIVEVSKVKNLNKINKFMINIGRHYYKYNYLFAI